MQSLFHDTSVVGNIVAVECPTLPSSVSGAPTTCFTIPILSLRLVKDDHRNIIDMSSEEERYNTKTQAMPS